MEKSEVIAPTNADLYKMIQQLSDKVQSLEFHIEGLKAEIMALRQRKY